MNLVTATSLLVATGEYYPGGGVLFDGQVQRIACSPREVRELAAEVGIQVQDLGAGLLAPGLVNAHAHLELTGVDTGPDRSFRGWLAGLMAARGASTHADRCRAATAGADELLCSGTTAVGDIDSTGAAEEALRKHRLRLRLYREVLDAYAPERTSRALKHVARRLGLRPGMSEGISPHAPYTVSPALLLGLREIAETHSLAVTIHWSETPEEVEWTLRGSGPMAGLIPRSPFRSGLDLIEEAGLLTSTTSLVHGNHPAPGELERIARAGSVCVHCPGSHAFFGRDPFPVADYMAADVPIALGTDSTASNDRLDMRREMSLMRAAHPGLRPEDVWTMATVNGARALGMSGESGTLRPGADADFCLWGVAAGDAGASLEALTAGIPEVKAGWIGGRQVSGRPV